MSHQQSGRGQPVNRETFDQPYYMASSTPQAFADPEAQDSRSSQSHANYMFLFGPPSMPASSPDSLTFSSDGRSQINQPSYLNTPSVSNVDLPRHLNGGSSEHLALQNNVNTGSKLTEWVAYDAANPTGKKDKNSRTCYPCYTRKQACNDGPKSTRCLFCRDSQAYCKGSIETPLFIRVDSLMQIADLASTRVTSMPDCLMSNVWPLANHHLEPKSIIQRSLPLRTPSLSADFPYISDIPAADEMLDILLAFEKTYPRPVKAGVDLTKFKGSCRRFCACMILLRSLNTCKVDTNTQSCHQIYHLALGFVMRLSLQANNLLTEIFEEVKVCCEAKRHAYQTRRLMDSLAYFLGQMFAEIRHLRRYAQSFPQLPLLQILGQISITENGLMYYGKAFGNEKFVTASRLDPQVLPGIHLQTSESSFPIQNIVGDIPSKEWPSVFSILSLDFTSIALRDIVSRASNAEAAASTNQCCDKFDTPNPGDTFPYSSLAVRRGILVAKPPLGQGRAPDIAQNKLLQLETEKTQLQTEIDRLQELVRHKEDEINAYKRPLVLVESVLEEFLYNEDDLYQSPTNGHSETDTLVQAEAGLPNVVQDFDNMDIDQVVKMLEDEPCHFFPSETDEDIDMGDVTETDEGNQLQKCERISSIAISREQNEGTQPAAVVADNVSRTTGMSNVQRSKCNVRKRSSTIKLLKQRFSGAHCEPGQALNTEATAVAEDANLIEIDDTNPPEVPRYERRPKTWPFRQGFRQSVDISVKTIVKGFERLRV